MYVELGFITFVAIFADTCTHRPMSMEAAGQWSMLYMAIFHWLSMVLVIQVAKYAIDHPENIFDVLKYCHWILIPVALSMGLGSASDQVLTFAVLRCLHALFRSIPLKEAACLPSLKTMLKTWLSIGYCKFYFT
jgi:hypothetical protein